MTLFWNIAITCKTFAPKKRQAMNENAPVNIIQIGALRQVVVDVPRTAPGVKILQTERLQKSLEHILYVWGIR